VYVVRRLLPLVESAPGRPGGAFQTAILLGLILKEGASLWHHAIIHRATMAPTMAPGNISDIFFIC
jgi:hypothetical protein